MKNVLNYSRIIAGTMTWGNWGKRLSTAQMGGLIKHSFKLGITTFDHADIYGDYTTEADFGKALAKSEIDRQSIRLISKCGIQMVSDNRNTQIKHYDYSTDHITASVERSLKNLNTEYLDLLLLHRPSPLMKPEEIQMAVSTLKKQGKVKEIGVSNFSPWQIAMLSNTIDIVANQVEFSLLQTTPMYDGTFDDCIAKNRIAMAWSPLGGFFNEKGEKAKRIKNAIEPMKKKYLATEDQLLLAWVLKHPAKVYPVVGTTNRERLQKSLEATMLELELEDWFLLLEASMGHPVP